MNSADYRRLTTREKYEYHKELARYYQMVWEATLRAGREPVFRRSYYYLHTEIAQELRLKLDAIDNNTGRN